MSQFFISSKESRIENNRSFYGCFYLGPFEPTQSLTIANTLRRTLLSEIYGLGIVSVEIDGATHEYSSLPGVRDSTLDILLNLKEIVLKKTISNFKPQIGYLRVRGPGVVRASHLRLPPFIQLVDPSQYIATLAENGVLNMKFVIQYGNKWLSSGHLSEPIQDSIPKELDDNSQIGDYSNNQFNFHLKRRRIILKKLKTISFGTNSFLNQGQYLNMLSKSSSFLNKYSSKKNMPQKRIALQRLIIKKYPALNLKTGVLKKLGNLGQPATNTLKNKNFDSFHKVRGTRTQSGVKKMVFTNSKPLAIDAIFNPINKINYIIETNAFKESPSKLELSTDTAELYEMLNTNSNLSLNNEKSLEPFPRNDSSLDNEKESSFNKISNDFYNEISQTELETILSLKREINMLKKETIKHNITLEIWTNGSIHPRDALYQSFKSLIKLFSNLKKLNTFAISEFDSNSLELKQSNNVINASDLNFKDNLDKKIKMGDLNGPVLKELMPLNEITFLATYTDPKIKNFYLNNYALKDIIKTSFMKSPETDFFPCNIFTRQNNEIKSQKLVNKKVEQKKLYYASDIGVLNLSLRCYTILKRLNIHTIKDLDQLFKEDLLKLSKVKNCRLNSSNLIEIEACLNNIKSYFK